MQFKLFYPDSFLSFTAITYFAEEQSGLAFTLKLLCSSCLPEHWRTRVNTLFDPVSQATGHIAFLHTAFQKSRGWQGQKPSCCAHPTGSILKPAASLQGGHKNLVQQAVECLSPSRNML